jgi:hypothetical protein
MHESDAHVPGPERAPGERARQRFWRGLGHPVMWTLLAAPVFAAFVLFGVLMPVWPITLLGAAAILMLAIRALVRGVRGLRGR